MNSNADNTEMGKVILISLLFLYFAHRNSYFTNGKLYMYTTQYTRRCLHQQDTVVFFKLIPHAYFRLSKSYLELLNLLKLFFKRLKVIRESLKTETIFLKAFRFSKSFLNIFQFQPDCLGRNSKRIVFYAIKSCNLLYSLCFSLPCFCYFLEIHIKQEINRYWA